MPEADGVDCSRGPGAWPAPEPGDGSDPLIRVVLPADEVHVWRVWLGDGPSSAHETVLSPDERARAERYRFSRDRSAFVATRGTLRHVLAAYLGLPGAAIRFSHGPHGKPCLDDRFHGATVGFNVSHSGAWALIAVARARRVGVDLELIQPDIEHEQLARRFFSPAEAMALEALPRAERALAFFECWTRKEAFVKALGLGMAMPLADFEVAFGPGQPPRLLRVAGVSTPPEQWAMRALAPAECYVGALLVEGHTWQLRTFDAQRDQASARRGPGIPGAP